MLFRSVLGCFRVKFFVLISFKKCCFLLGEDFVGTFLKFCFGFLDVFGIVLVFFMLGI